MKESNRAMNGTTRLQILTISAALVAAISTASAASTTTKTSKTTTTKTTTTTPAATYPVANPGSTASSGDDYKSYHPENNFTFGGSTGFGLVDTHGGFTLIGNIAAKVVKDGWIPDIVNPVFLEAEFGPTFVSGATFWMYSAHFRWDFVKDNKWTLFALGGLGGNFGSNRYGDRVSLYPRFGVGAFYALDTVDLRFEFSHELITAGVSIPF